MTRSILSAMAIFIVALGAFGGAALAQGINTTEGDPPPAVVIAGSNRYETAVAISRASFPQNETAILYIASGETLVDALVVGVTNEQASKMLLVTRDSVPEVTAEEIQRLRVHRVVFLGGDAAISPAVRDEVMSLVNRY